MADEAAGYIHLLKLAVDWANAGSLPKEMVLRRLCEWAVVGAFPRGALVDRFGTEIAPLEMFKDFKALTNSGNVSIGGWGMHIDPAEALHRFEEIRVAANDLRAFCDGTNTILPPLLFSGFRRLWAGTGGKNVAPPACPGADEEADRQHARGHAEGWMNTLRRKMNSLQGKPADSSPPLRPHRPGEEISFNYVGSEWGHTRAMALCEIRRAGDDDGALGQRLDQLDTEWVAFVEAEARSPADLAWAARVMETRSDWREIANAARFATNEEFPFYYVATQNAALPPPTTAAAEFSENQENSSVALAEPPIESRRRRGRPSGSGSFQAVDEPLIEEMQSLIATTPSLSIHGAADRVADRAQGSTERESRIKRLMQRYSDKFGG